MPGEQPDRSFDMQLQVDGHMKMQQACMYLRQTNKRKDFLFFGRMRREGDGGEEWEGGVENKGKGGGDGYLVQTLLERNADWVI